MTTFLHYFCYIFHTHCFLVNILLYVVIISMCISCIKWKGRLKQIFKASVNFLLIHSLLFCFLILILMILNFIKCKMAVAEKFMIFNLCRPLFKIWVHRQVWPPPLFFFIYSWFTCNLETTYGAILTSQISAMKW